MIIYIKYSGEDEYKQITRYSITKEDGLQEVEINNNIFHMLNKMESLNDWYYHEQKIEYFPNLHSPVFLLLDKNNNIECITNRELPNSVKTSYTNKTFEKEYNGIDITNGKYKYLNNQITYVEDNELSDVVLEDLRRKREHECFPIINRGQMWYMSLSSEQLQELKKWYQAWLDVTETGIIPEKPFWLGEEQWQQK